MAQQLTSGFSCLGTGASGDFEIGIVTTVSVPYTIVMTDMTSGQELPGSRRTITPQSPTRFDCHYWAHFDSVGSEDPNRVQFLPDRLYRIDMLAAPGSSYESGSFYTFHPHDCTAGSSLFCPAGMSPADIVFFLTADGPRTYPEDLGQFGYGGQVSVENLFPDGRWVLPYDLEQACSACSPGLRSTVFVTPAPLTGSGPATRPVQLTAAANTDWKLPAGSTINWSSSDVSAIWFGTGGRVTSSGVLNSTGISFGAADPGQGWSGIRVPGGSATFSGQSTIQNSGVTVTGGTFTLDDRSRVVNAPGNGIYATGSSSRANVVNRSQIQSSGAIGILVENGARASVSDLSAVVSSSSMGVRARNWDSQITLATGSRVEASGHAGTYSDVYGEVAFTAGQAVTIRDNGARIHSETGASLDTDVGRHRFLKTPGSGGIGYDVFGMDYSSINADLNFWGQNVQSSADLVVDNYDATILIDPVLTTDPGAGLRSAGASETAPRSGPFVSALGTDTAQGWTETAEDAARAGHADAAVDAIERGLGAASAETDRRRVWSAAARLAARLHGPGARQSATAASRLDALATRALQNTKDAPWALRALAIGAAVSPDGRTRAREYTEALLALPNSERAATNGSGRSSLSHAALARLIETRLAVEGNDEAGALRALSALAATDAEQAALAAASVTARFPEAAVSAAMASARPVSRGAPESPTAESSWIGARLLTVSPNPTSGDARFSFALDAPAEVSLSVYDALGRRVASIPTTTREAGPCAERLDVGSLPAGMYVARLVVQPAGEPASMQTTRFTVVR